MTRRKKLVFGAAAAAAALLGLGAAGAIAASNILSPDEASEAIIDDAAQQLGVAPDALSAALKQALKNRVDEAVKAGRLTEEQGTELKNRIDSDERPLLFGPGVPFKSGFGFGMDFGFGRHLLLDPELRFDPLEGAASYLGLTEAELREALQDKTLAEIAKDKGKSVSGLVNALVAAQEDRIDEAVADGRITKQQASELKARLTEHVEALVNGEHHGLREKFHPGLWPGAASPRAPPALFGPIA